jgi:hypothetical protein
MGSARIANVIPIKAQRGQKWWPAVSQGCHGFIANVVPSDVKCFDCVTHRGGPDALDQCAKTVISNTHAVTVLVAFFYGAGAPFRATTKPQGGD